VQLSLKHSLFLCFAELGFFLEVVSSDDEFRGKDEDKLTLRNLVIDHVSTSAWYEAEAILMVD